MVFVLRLARVRAAVRGTNRNSAIAARTRSAVYSMTGVFPVSTRLTVAMETPACSATSEIVAYFLIFFIRESVFRKRFHSISKLPHNVNKLAYFCCYALDVSVGFIIYCMYSTEIFFSETIGVLFPFCVKFGRAADQAEAREEAFHIPF